MKTLSKLGALTIEFNVRVHLAPDWKKLVFLYTQVYRTGFMHCFHNQLMKITW